jgi:AcrR family transcriptional regulator
MISIILTVQSLGGKNKPTSRFLFSRGKMQHRSEETRSKIIASAIKLFSIQGFNAASVDVICKDAGISKGAFYHHFKSKQALFLALLDVWLQTIDTAIESSKDKTVPETYMQMTEAFPYIFQTAGEGLPMFLEFWLQASRDDEIWQASIAPYRRYHKYFKSLIKKGVDEGSFVDVDPELTARMIVSMAMGLLLQSLLDPKGAKWDKTAREITTMMMDTLIRKSEA